MKTPTWTDPIVDEIHEIRKEMAREADYDVHKLVAQIQESQKRHGNKLVTRPPKPPVKQFRCTD